MKDVNDKVAAITGAASGMGRTLVLELARRGCPLALSDIDTAGLATTASLVRAANAAVRISTTRVDMADRAAVVAWADQAAAELGRINLVFNQAGVALSDTLEKVPQQDFEWLMVINFWGVVWGTQAFLPHLRASGDGHVVNTSSLFGLLAMPLNGCYNTSKFAVRGYTEALRLALALGGAPVSTTCVHPGGVRAEIARSARAARRCWGATRRWPAPTSTRCWTSPRPNQPRCKSCGRLSATSAGCWWGAMPGGPTSWFGCWARGTSRWWWPAPAAASAWRAAPAG